MMLRHFARDVARRSSKWDSATKTAVSMAVVMLIILALLGFAGPQPIQMPSRIGAFGLLITLQLLFLWGNRRDISPYHQAQRRFIAGDFAAARDVLEAIPDGGRESVDALVLLGNCYRHLAHYDQSSRALRRALELNPAHHLALFSLGKLLLVLGECAESVNCIERALDAGSPDIVRFELGQAHFLHGDHAAARREFKTVRPLATDAPEQAALLDMYMRVIDDESPLPMPAEYTAHWHAEAQKYADTPYGEHLREFLP